MYTIIKIVRVAHLINGSSAKSKRIRVYRRDVFENRVKNEETGRLEYTDLKTTDYLELSPSGIIDNLIVTNVVEAYERITQPSKKVKVKKSNACPKTELISEKGKLKAEIRNLRNEKIELKTDCLDQIKALQNLIKITVFRQPRKFRIKAHNTISVRINGKRVYVNIPTNHVFKV